MLSEIPFERRDKRLFHEPPTPVKVWQFQWEFEQLLNLYMLRRPTRVLEIGSASGGTLYHWLRQAGRNAVVISVDIGSQNPGQWGSWARKDVTLIRIQAESQLESTVKLVSDVTTRLDWLFIDGAHDYNSVRADWDLYRPFMQAGSIVAIHDILPHPETGVPQLWREIQRKGYMTREFIADESFDDGMGIGVVYIE